MEHAIAARKHCLEEAATSQSTKQKLPALDSPSGKEVGKENGQPDAAAQSTPSTTQANKLDKAAQELQVVPDGDLILVVGPERRRLHVYSLLLKMSSHPLAAIINAASSAEDGQKPEICLLHDDAEAFEAFCMHFHMPNSLHPLMTAKLLGETAILAEKYECTDRFIYAADAWLEALKTTCLLQDTQIVWTLTTAALLFGRAKWFKLYSSRLVGRCGSYLGYAKRCHDSNLGIKLACKFDQSMSRGTFDLTDPVALEEKRNAVRMEQSRSLFDESIYGLCLRCFTEAGESFAPQADCLDCSKHKDDKRLDDGLGTSAPSSGTIRPGKGLFGGVQASHPSTPAPSLFGKAPLVKDNVGGGNLFGGGGVSNRFFGGTPSRGEVPSDAPKASSAFAAAASSKIFGD